MAIQQTILSVFLLAGFIAAIETPTGTYEMCKKSPRQLDLKRCTITSSMNNVNQVADYLAIIAGECNVTFPDDVQVLKDAIHFKTTYLTFEQQASVKAIVNILNSYGQPLIDEYIPGGEEIIIQFKSLCRESFDYLGKTGIIFMEFIFEDQPKYDGWCIMAKAQIVDKPLDIQRNG